MKRIFGFYAVLVALHAGHMHAVLNLTWPSAVAFAAVAPLYNAATMLTGDPETLTRIFPVRIFFVYREGGPGFRRAL